MRLGLNIDRRRFALVAGLQIAVLAVIIVVFMVNGVALAAFPIAGIGGFVIEADQVIGEGFSLYPIVGETAEQGDSPQAAVDLGKATIIGLRLSKELPVAGRTAKVVITSSGNVVGSGVKLRVTGITADNASFEGLDAEEHYGDYSGDGKVDASDKIDLKAPNVVLENTAINGHALFATTIVIPGMGLDLQFH
ncbi:MAG: hypothetical protein C4589_10410 [Peptococcaceae bacterium]|nr:MAG: hypothetical protein C4589_10410 [Peptococcaceae bacterium]